MKKDGIDLLNEVDFGNQKSNKLLDKSSFR